MFKKIVIESPYAGNTKKNLIYAGQCMRNAILRGEAPIASHVLYTGHGILEDCNVMERMVGLNLGYQWGLEADLVAFYTDNGMSRGMDEALEFYGDHDILTVERKLFGTEEELQGIEI